MRSVVISRTVLPAGFRLALFSVGHLVSCMLTSPTLWYRSHSLEASDTDTVIVTLDRTRIMPLLLNYTVCKAVVFFQAC